MKAIKFEDWSLAYDHCRRQTIAPITAQVRNEIAKIYPSGAYKPIQDACQQCGIVITCENKTEGVYCIDCSIKIDDDIEDLQAVLNDQRP